MPRGIYKFVKRRFYYIYPFYIRPFSPQDILEQCCNILCLVDNKFKCMNVVVTSIPFWFFKKKRRIKILAQVQVRFQVHFLISNFLEICIPPNTTGFFIIR